MLLHNTTTKMYIIQYKWYCLEVGIIIKKNTIFCIYQEKLIWVNGKIKLNISGNFQNYLSLNCINPWSHLRRTNKIKVLKVIRVQIIFIHEKYTIVELYLPW